MKNIIKNQAAQGDVMFRRLDAMPAGFTETTSHNGSFVVAHSETGHNHIVLERPGVRMFSGMDDLRALLVVEGDPVTVEHQRSFDTHAPLTLPAGIWEIRRQREYTPEGFRRAAD